MSRGNLLVITNGFPNEDNSSINSMFVKEQLRHIAPGFEKVHVVAPSMMVSGSIRGTHHEDYSFDNVEVHFLSYLNVPLFHFFGRGIWISLEAGAVRRLLKGIGAEFDLVHAHYTWPAGAVAARLKPELGAPLVITEHTSLTVKRAIDRGDPVFKDAWDATDAIIRVRKGDIHRFSSVGVPEGKVHYIPNGFDGGKFRPMDQAECRRSLGLPLDKKIVMTVGNLIGGKGQKYLISAMREVAEKDRSVVCVIVGGGKLDRKLRRQVARLGLSDTVLMVGRKPHSEVGQWLNACDIFTLSSLTEGNPTVMFEALACGKPFVGSNVGGIPEVICSPDLGLLSDPMDVDGLAANLLSAASRSWDRELILEHARQFEWTELVGQVNRVYDSVLRRS